MEEIFDVSRGKERKLAMIAMGGADDEDGLLGGSRAAGFGGVFPILRTVHGRFLRCETCSTAG
jgi:hypothetical protein